VFPPLWVCAVAAVPVLGLGLTLYRWVLHDEAARVGEENLQGARARAGIASLVFTSGIAIAGWLVWLLAEVPPRAVVFVVLWAFVALYFVIAAGAFKTQMGRFMPWRQGFGTAMRETTLHLIEALLWGPITVKMLLSKRRP
jgi:hypothetical protein